MNHGETAVLSQRFILLSLLKEIVTCENTWLIKNVTMHNFELGSKLLIKIIVMCSAMGLGTILSNIKRAILFCSDEDNRVSCIFFHFNLTKVYCSCNAIRFYSLVNNRSLSMSNSMMYACSFFIENHLQHIIYRLCSCTSILTPMSS